MSKDGSQLTVYGSPLDSAFACPVECSVYSTGVIICFRFWHLSFIADFIDHITNDHQSLFDLGLGHIKVGYSP